LVIHQIKEKHEAMYRILVRLSLICALASVLTLPAALPNVSAQAFVITDNVVVPIDFIATACDGQTVIISGESRVIVHSVTSDSGQTAFRTHIQFHLSGEAPDGTRYTANETVNSTETTGAGSATTLTSIGQLHLISAGSDDNLTGRTTIHTTVNANGQVTSQSFEFTTECNG
jgi:hypothetical protein